MSIKWVLSGIFWYREHIQITNIHHQNYPFEALVLIGLLWLSSRSLVFDRSFWNSDLSNIVRLSWLSSSMVSSENFFHFLDGLLDVPQKINCFWRLLFSRRVTWAIYFKCCMPQTFLISVVLVISLIASLLNLKLLEKQKRAC